MGLGLGLGLGLEGVRRAAAAEATRLPRDMKAGPASGIGVTTDFSFIIRLEPT